MFLGSLAGSSPVVQYCILVLALTTLYACDKKNDGAYCGTETTFIFWEPFLRGEYILFGFILRIGRLLQLFHLSCVLSVWWWRNMFNGPSENGVNGHGTKLIEGRHHFQKGRSSPRHIHLHGWILKEQRVYKRLEARKIFRSRGTRPMTQAQDANLGPEHIAGPAYSGLVPWGAIFWNYAATFFNQPNATDTDTQTLTHTPIRKGFCSLRVVATDEVSYVNYRQKQGVFHRWPVAYTCRAVPAGPLLPLSCFLPWLPAPPPAVWL